MQTPSFKDKRHYDREKHLKLINKDKKLVKLTNEECCHNGFSFSEGLNVDTVPFDPTGKCQSGGIYFIHEEDIYLWLHYGGKIMYYIWDVEVPADAQVYDEGNKFKADKLILKNKRTINNYFINPLPLAIKKYKNRG